jgi:hypothetical protein
MQVTMTRFCCVFLALSWNVGGAPAVQRERMLESVLPVPVYGPTCWSALELRNLGELPATVDVEGHHNSGALAPLAGNARMRVRLQPGEQASYKIETENDTGTAWIRVRETIPASVSAPVVAIGGKTECVAGNHLSSAPLEVAFPTRNPWFSGDVSEIRGDLLTLINTSERAATASLCYSTGGLYSRSREGQPGQELAPICSTAFEVQIPPFGVRQFPVERDGNSHLSLKTQGEAMVLQMLRPLDARQRVFTVDSTIKFEDEPSPSAPSRR